jgi:hypothetical protein
MKRSRGLICCFLCIGLAVMMSSRSAAAQSYCPGCAAAVIGAGVAVGAGVGFAVYFVHRSHTSLTGCVEQTEHGLTLTAKNGSNYALINAPSEVKADRRLAVRGHKTRTASGHAFRVDHLSQDYGPCGK